MPQASAFPGHPMKMCSAPNWVNSENQP